MSGSIHYRKLVNGGWHYIIWYDKSIKRGREVTWYRGLRMYDKRLAQKLLAEMQGEFERGVFQLQRYLGKGGWTDVLGFFEDWLLTKQKKKPATIKGYRSYYRTWIKPFFERNPVMLHEVGLSVLDKLLDSIKLTGKGKHNVMMCFHAFMDYAWRSGKISEVPPFPKKEDYGIVEPTIKWLPEARQMAIIEAIPEVHRPIFLWLKYHLRRPAEACALLWEDYDAIGQVFTIRRSISARKTVESTKTGVAHIVPCHPAFSPFIRKEQILLGQHFFQNPRARKDGRRYTNESLNVIWKAACKKAGESIDLYSGLKHSSCSQYVNEKGYSVHDVQAMTDHARLESVNRYAKVSVARKLELFERGNVVPFRKIKQMKGGG